ncbi:MAG: anti-sigma factor family protein [Anaerolineae bacterium]
MDAHDEYFPLMSLALDEEATPTELGRLHAHLRSCPSCTQAWEAWLALDHCLASAPMVAPSPDLAEKVMARVAQAARQGRKAGWLGWGLWAGAVSLAVMLIFWAGLVFLWFQGRLAEFGDVVVRWLAALGLLARGLAAAATGFGVPTLGSALAVLSGVTGVLGLAWLWLFVHCGCVGRTVVARY